MNKRQSKKKYFRDLKSLWARIGFIVQLSQMIEYNLLNILAGGKYISLTDGLSLYDFEQWEKAVKESNDVLHRNKEKPLGALLKLAVKDDLFTDEFVSLLWKVVERRNHYIHQFYKDDLVAKKLEANPSYFFREIREDIGLLKHVNDWLLEIDMDNRKLA